MLFLRYLRRILKKTKKTGSIEGRKIVPEKSKVNLVRHQTFNDSKPNDDSTAKGKCCGHLKRQNTAQELDVRLAKLRTTLSSTSSSSENPKRRHSSYMSNPPPILVLSPPHYSATASSTVSEDEEEYFPVRARQSNMVRKISSSKKRRFSSPPVQTNETSIPSCYSQNGQRFQFLLSHSFLPSEPIEEDALSLTNQSVSLPDPMQPFETHQYIQ